MAVEPQDAQKISLHICMIQNLIANIPVFDWTGPVFLFFYLTALVLVIPWCIRRRNQERASFQHDDYRIPHDPYMAAYLTGGARRAALVALIALTEKKLIQRIKRWNGVHVATTPLPAPLSLPALESALVKRIQTGGRKGVLISEINRQINDEYAMLEAQLANRGLRPTQSERIRAAWSAVSPLVILCVVGVIKLMIGIFRDKPIGFLILLLIVTGVAAVWIANSLGYLTAHGKSALEELRNQYTPGRGDNTAMSVALFGSAALVGFPELSTLAREFEVTIGAGSSSSDGSGCSSGCSSGCGGGCGGCGGGD